MSSLRRLLCYLRPYRRSIVISLLCLLLSTPAQLFPPLVWKYIADTVIAAQQQQQLGPALLLMLVVQLLAVALESWRGYSLGVVGQQFVYDLREVLYTRIQAHSLRFFHDRRSGDLVSRAIADVDSLQEVVINGVDNIVASGLQFVGVAVIMVWLNWQVGLLTLLPMGGVALLVWFYNRRVRGLYRRIRDRLGDVSAKLQENLLGILVIKAFAREKHEITRFLAENQRYLGEARKGVLARSVYFPAVRTVGFLSSMVMIGVGALFILRGQFTVGDLLAFRSYWWQLFFPVFSLAQINEMLQRANAAASRIWEVLDEPLEIVDAPAAVALPTVRGALALEGVSFGYQAAQPVLCGVDLTVPPGGRLGVVGPSGSGKSTLLALLLRLYDPTAGRLRLDGHDLRELTQESLRRSMAVVTQEPFLFNDSIRANIVYGRPEATAEEIETAARQANAHDFIGELPDGYETVVGERGVKLSGGQKQRLCIARAFLADPRVLLLDEATAAVEPESEAIIQAALERLMVGRTTVIVSHRLSMVRDCSPILVVRHGAIDEQGSHEELLAHDGWYARMYRLQMRVGDDV
ncbi:MAG: ABC transporter ATP-binding protein [Fimbriimonadaceae bacterium]|nr:ABC transporter ATP-binding protein [Fimbriimonadaceae bacterium]